jgi:phosphoserine phosphatase RsbU/P
VTIPGSADTDADAEQRYDRAPCGHLSTTADGLITQVNQTFLDLTGYRREELVGRRTFAQLLSAGGRIYHETHYAPLLQMHGSARAIALDIMCADGAKLPVLVNAVLERDAEGQPLVVRTAVFDATERREYERELLRAKRRAEESEEHARSLARTLQQTLIPPTPPDIPGLDVAAVYRPAGSGDEVGGDFYDVFQIGVDDWVVTVGDVCGKGVQAAVITALARYTLRASMVQLQDSRLALEVLNDMLLRHESGRFCTVVLVRLRREAGLWAASVTAGGHPLPMLVVNGAAPVAFGEPGSLIGVVESLGLHATERVLAPGDALVLYTDGVTEGRRGDEFFGEGRLAAVIDNHYASAAALVDGLLAAVLDFQSGNTRDDTAIVVVRIPD